MAIITRQFGDLVYLVDEQIPVPHAFTTRLGGVSEGIYASLNLRQNLGDDPAAILENYNRITAALGTRNEDLVFSRQVHGDAVRAVGPADQFGDIFRAVAWEADGLVTAERDVALAVFTADCIPVLLWDASTGAVGAVHAGWRSTVLDIVGKAVGKLMEFGADPQTIRAAIGPGIGACCFETGSEVSAAVRAILGEEAEDSIRELEDGKAVVDLKEVNRRLLVRAGLLPAHITVAVECTMCLPDLFWSHRVTEGLRGAQAAMIVMRETE
ncbi:MAG: peptidoglycan editing factor PgeF [Oscillospiraceae bacterium]|nr:peptidoglycan editing factor PgeF [Oscillospiraceae bacterium]